VTLSTTLIAQAAEAASADLEIDLRPMMAAFPTGVAIITATGGNRQPLGMTCSSLCSASLRPPVVLACLRRGSPTLAAIRRGGGFTLNLLQSHATPAARLFASGRPDRFNLVRWAPGRNGHGPRLADDAHTIADLAVIATYPVGDHVAVAGQVLAVEEVTRPEPLMYGLRQFLPWHTCQAPPFLDAA
jgi:flavin reductase (DIM6/NTAB) family NADH-FMN oxidoreductase RutF